MLEAIPKVTDISSLKGISTLLTIPLICVAYTLQTGAIIGWGSDVWFDVGEFEDESVELARLILIFVLKSLWISAYALFVYCVLVMVHIESEFPLLQVVSTILIALAIFGLFGLNEYPQLKSVSSFWFYSLIVWGVFLQTMVEQLNAEYKK